MRTSRLFILVSLALTFAWIDLAFIAHGKTIYVSPRGNDQWSGQFPTPAANGQDGPLATLTTAIAKARVARQQLGQTAEAIEIILRHGVYELADRIELTAEDSGMSADKPFVIASFPNEKAVLSGGRRIQGWEPVRDLPGLWQTKIDDVAAGRWFFRQLFVDGKRKQRARTPNHGYFRIQGPSPQDKPVKIKFRPGDIKREWVGDVELIALLAWADIRMQIREVDETTHTATLSGDPRPSNKENYARYFIENAPDALDSPGEWFLDRKTGILTYWPEPGQDMSKAEVIAPRLEELIWMHGDFGTKRPIRHLVFRGLTFRHTDWTIGDQGYADTQAAVATPGEIRAEAAVDSRIEDCSFEHLAGYAIDLGRGCQRIAVTGNRIFDLGAGGIRIGEPGVRSEPFELNHSHQITDNEMHQLGRVYPPAVGVFILQSGQNRVAHNHIHDLFYTAISVGWTWGYRETPCRENVIEFNHLHHIGQAMLSDMGAIYTLGIQKGTMIRNNLIHDVESFTYGGWGLYPDEGSSEILWENNVVYRTKSAGFHQHYGRENIVRNNIFAFGREFQLMRTRNEPHISFSFENNIVYFDSGKLLGSTWSNDKFVINRNIYFDTRAKTPDAIQFAGATLAEWRARGHDVDSIIANPEFVAPDQFDFRLKPSSPALKLGFKPIDLSSVGVRPKGRSAEESTSPGH